MSTDIKNTNSTSVSPRKILSEGMASIIKGISKIFSSKANINNDNIFTLLEELLLNADLGISATNKIMADIKLNKITKNTSVEEVKKILAKSIGASIYTKSILEGLDAYPPPHVIMFCGINGSGKTSSIAKLANLLHHNNKKVGIAACDTFRAAAVEQLKVWGQRINVPVFSKDLNTDPASVAYSALANAEESGLDYLLVDTAGRMHNQPNLMEELAKIERVMKKIDPNAPHRKVLVIDGNSGQNAHKQASAYLNTIKTDGMIVTKLDGSSKGGVVVGLMMSYNLPVYYVCVGEQIEDIKEFDTELFAASLLDIYHI